jgi:hypothetical protein
MALFILFLIACAAAAHATLMSAVNGYDRYGHSKLEEFRAFEREKLSR